MKLKKGKGSMVSRNKKCLLCGVLAMFVLTSASVCSAASSDDVEAMRQEIKELKLMVQGLTKEVRVQKKDIREDQQQLQDIREDVSKLSDSPMVGLADTLGKIKFGGYADIHAKFTESSDSDNLDYHRLVLYLGYDFADWIKFHSETELEHASTDDGYVLLEQGYVDFLLSDTFNVRAGRVLTPLGIINQHHEPTLFNGVERPNFAKYIIPSTWSSDGVGIFGSLNPSLSYEAYVVGGLDGTGFDEGGIRGGRIKSKASLNDVAFTGRLDYRPLADEDLRLGISGYYGGTNNVSGGGANGENGEISMTSADFEYSISKFDFRGVIAHTEISNATELGNGVADEMFGWYIEGGYHFWPEEWKTGKLAKSDAVVFVRYEEYDTQHKMPGGVAKDKTKDREEITFGINFYLTNNFVIKADYQLLSDASSSDKDDLLNIGLGWTF
jgi:hypothetical protein